MSRHWLVWPTCPIAAGSDAPAAMAVAAGGGGTSPKDQVTVSDWGLGLGRHRRLPPGRYTTPVGGEVELRADGRLNVAGTPYLAGAALPLAAALGTLARAGFSQAKVVRLVLTNPATIAGIEVGLEPGARAVFCQASAAG